MRKKDCLQFFFNFLCDPCVSFRLEPPVVSFVLRRHISQNQKFCTEKFLSIFFVILTGYSKLWCKFSDFVKRLLSKYETKVVLFYIS